MNKEFTISFWIKIKDNPGWMKKNSTINFPRNFVNGGILVYAIKHNKELKVYILHPEIGYRKITANVTKYLQRDAFIALTNSEETTKLYVNAELVKKLPKNKLLGELEIGDYVMVKNRIKNEGSQEEMKIIMPGKIVGIKDSGKSLTINILDGTDKFTEVGLDDIHY